MDEQTQYKLSVEQGEERLRLDKFIATKIPELSRSRIKPLIENGHVLHQLEIISDCSYRVKPADEFVITLPEVKESTMQANDKIKLDIVYEDEQFLVVNKQAGLTVHPGAGNQSETMANALMAYCGDSLSGIGGVSRPGIVHRLDKDTSGLILVAKTDKAHNHLSKQIAERSMGRKYLAVCWGVPKPHSGTIESEIGRNPKNRLKMASVTTGGKHAVTHYKVKEILAGGIASLVECKLQTGRTHQIRVHLSEAGYPLIGDPLYSRKSKINIKGLSDEAREFLKSFKRQALHSFHLEVENPTTNTHMEYRSDLPEDIARLVELLRG